jgi:hypothetical protein
MYNNAVRRSTRPFLWLMDADIIFNRELVGKTMDSMCSHPWLIGFTRCWRLSESASQRLLAAPVAIELDAGLEYEPGRPPSRGPGGINILTREAYEAVGGYDESFYGWGEEDKAFEIALTRLVGKPGRVPACEVLINTAAVRENIRDMTKSLNIPDLIKDGTVQYGMQSFDQSLMQWYSQGVISYENALFYSTSPSEFALRIQGIAGTSDTSWDGFGSGESQG